MRTWFPLLYLDGFSLLHEVLGISDMVGEPPTRGQRMLAISLATVYVIEPLLDTMSLRGMLFCGFWESIKFWGGGTSGVRFFVSILDDLFLGFADFEDINKLTFVFGSWVLG